MLKSDKQQSIRVVSSTLPEGQIEEILKTPGVYVPRGHYLYPVTDGDRVGNHLDSLFLIEPIAAKPQSVDWIVDDICRFLDREKIAINVIFAPAQPAVRTIVNELAQKLGVRAAYWEYLPTGWFGNKLVSGEVRANDKVLVFNGVSQQERCVGERLPAFVQQLGGNVVAAAVFAIGTAPGAKAAQDLYGSKLYAAVQVDIAVQSPSTCTACATGTAQEPTPWTKFRDNLPG